MVSNQIITGGKNDNVEELFSRRKSITLVRNL